MAKDAKKTESKSDSKIAADKKISAGSIGFPSGRRTPSMESTKSEIPGVADQTVLTPEGGSPPESYGTYLYDCCAFVIYCPKHSQIAMSKGKGKGIYKFVILKKILYILSDRSSPASSNRMVLIYISFSPLSVHTHTKKVYGYHS